MGVQIDQRSEEKKAEVSSIDATGLTRAEFAVKGMSCSNCARQVMEAIQKVPGIANASVSLEEGRASVRWQPEHQAAPEAVIRAVANAGYTGELLDAEAASGCGSGCEHIQAGWGRNLWLGLLCAIPLMLGEWVFGLAMQPWFQWLAFGLATIVQFFAGGRFYRGAWRQLKSGNSNMDTLVALGSTTAYAYSVWLLFSGRSGHLYFMEAAAIVTLISVGHWLEARASSQASSALRRLLDLAPPLARRREPDGTERDVPVAQLRVNEIIALRPGDRVPIDGEVLEGNFPIDESMLTGESLPVEKAPGEPVYAGTINLRGRLVIRVTGTGEQTALAHIIAAVQRAQTSRANIQRLGDRVSSVFVPIVIFVAIAAGLWWGLASHQAQQAHHWLATYLWAAHLPPNPLEGALIVAASVLIVACPCAMGLATPVAILAGANAAAQRGILIRDGVALEKAGQITAVLLDKTGTITMGKPEVVRMNVCATVHAAGPERPGESGPFASRLAASLARHSSHPLSQAVVKLSEEELKLNEWQEVRGAGVQGIWTSEKGDASMVRLGSLKWLAENGVDLTAGNAFAEEWTARGASVLGVAMDEELSALLAVADTLKPNARAVVEELRRQGLKVFLVTGDNQRTAAAIAEQAGIAAEDVFAEVRPEQKADLVKNLQQQKERIAFVGDGINDAPALEQADLGIAVARASDIAREAADIILLRSEIEAVPESLGLAKATLRTIKQNLFWAFFYNAASVPLAALGFLSPVLCAATMAFSDLILIGNALRLKRYRITPGQ